MANEDALIKAQRYFRISHLLCGNPHGLTTDELATHCNVSQRTIQRDLRELEELGVPLWEDELNKRYGLLEGYYVPPVRLTADDALAFYLAGRLLSQYSDNHDPHIRDALAKLARSLPGAMERHIQRMGDNAPHREGDAFHAGILSVLGRGWAMERKVRLVYWASQRDETKTHVIHPYFLEPSAVNSGTYVIGYDEEAEALRTFKVERVTHAELLAEGFMLPETFDPAELLDSCWGIMYGDERQRVVMRFDAQVTRRVRESCWHPSQEITACDDGGCELLLWIANPMELTYWVRGWGPMVEVLEPIWLREQLAQEARQSAELYRDVLTGQA